MAFFLKHNRFLLEDIITRALGKQQSRVVDVGDVELQVRQSSHSRRQTDLKIDNAVRDGLTMD